MRHIPEVAIYMDAPRNDISIAFIAAAPTKIFDFICLWNSLQSPAKFIFLYKKLNTIILFFMNMKYAGVILFAANFAACAMAENSLQEMFDSAA